MLRAVKKDDNRRTKMTLVRPFKKYLFSHLQLTGGIAELLGKTGGKIGS